MFTYYIFVEHSNYTDILQAFLTYVFFVYIRSGRADSLNSHCESEESGESSSLFYLILVGLMICGIGGAPIQPLGYAYVDDFTEKHESGFYIGDELIHFDNRIINLIYYNTELSMRK